MAERPDWTLFRSIEGLCQKAGVPNRSLRRLVMKEIGDNALDTGADIRFGLVDADSPDLFFVEDDGPGLDGTPEEIASLFSISRPLRSSKLLRLPQRGALGNGLRVAAGAVLASQGSLAVITRNRRIVLRPRRTGPPPSSRSPRSITPSAPASRSDSVRRYQTMAIPSLGSPLPPASPATARAMTAKAPRTGTTRCSFMNSFSLTDRNRCAA
jgi:hypothetical protein